MPDFLNIWGVLILAFFALIQPWIIAAWKRFFRQQKVELYEAGAIEIGFGGLGPTIALQGTARAINRDAFIHSATLKIVREKDKSEHHFHWGLFRPPGLVPQQQSQFEICAGFLLTERAPRRVNVLFFEPSAVDDIRPHIELLRQAWSKKIAESPLQVLFEQAQPGQTFQTEIHQFLNQMYNEFSQQDIHINTFSVLQRLFYWEVGLYNADLQILTARPDRTYTFSWRFEIATENAELLRSNIIKVLMEACGQPTGGYNFVFPSYMPIKDT